MRYDPRLLALGRRARAAGAAARGLLIQTRRPDGRGDGVEEAQGGSNFPFPVPRTKATKRKRPARQR